MIPMELTSTGPVGEYQLQPIPPELPETVPVKKPLYRAEAAQGWGKGLEELREFMEAQTFAGSVAMFGEGQDVDLAIYVTCELPWARQQCIKAGWEFNREDYPEDEMFTCRKGPLNLIVTTSRMVWDSFDRGAQVCKFLYESHLLKRDDRNTRIVIHQILRKERDA